MDAVRQEIAATARDIVKHEERQLLKAEYWYKNDILQELLDVWAYPRWIIPERKLYTKVRISPFFEREGAMDNFGGESLAQYGTPTGARIAIMPTLKDRIANAVLQAEEKLKQVREASAILERNPDLEKLLNIMQRNHF